MTTSPLQIVTIHGGTAFDSQEDYMQWLQSLEPTIAYLKKKSWKETLQAVLGENFDVLHLQMPCKQNAHYEEWKIVFEKYLTLLNEEIVLVGHSLGGIFLLKYLSETSLDKKVKALYLIAAPISDEGLHESLGDFIVGDSLDAITTPVEKVVIIHSKDDPVVPFAHAEMLHTMLRGSELITLDGVGHCNNQEFSELIASLKELT